MGRLYRKPKRINLKPFIRESNCSFALARDSFTVRDLALIRKVCAGIILPERIQTEGAVTDKSTSILIGSLLADPIDHERCAPQEWRGFVVVDGRHNIDSAVNFLTHRARYTLTNRYWAPRPANYIGPFVVNMNAVPALITFFGAANPRAKKENETQCLK